MALQPQIYKGGSRPRILPHVMSSVAMGLKLLVFRFLLTTRTKTKATQMHQRSSRAVRRLRVFIFTLRPQ